MVPMHSNCMIIANNAKLPLISTKHIPIPQCIPLAFCQTLNGNVGWHVNGMHNEMGVCKLKFLFFHIIFIIFFAPLWVELCLVFNFFNHEKDSFLWFIYNLLLSKSGIIWNGKFYITWGTFNHKQIALS